MSRRHKDTIISEQMKEIETLKEENFKLQSKIWQMSVYPFGEEPTHYITEDMFDTILETPETSLTEYIQAKHLTYNETFNVCLLNKEDSNIVLIVNENNMSCCRHVNRNEFVAMWTEQLRNELKDIAQQKNATSWLSWNESTDIHTLINVVDSFLVSECGPVT